MREKWILIGLLTSIVGIGVYVEVLKPKPCERLADYCSQAHAQLDIRRMSYCTITMLSFSNRNQSTCKTVLNAMAEVESRE